VQVWGTEAVADGEVKVKEDVSCRWTGGVRTDVSLGPRDPETGWLAAVVDTWDIDKHEKT
jgi:hypothetical protein